jgi:hypothetical protein
VIHWKGESYNAIVLAGDWSNEFMNQTADKVYVDIGATRPPGMNEQCYHEWLHLAVENECEMACSLLKDMTIYICNTFNDMFTPKFLKEKLNNCTAARKTARANSIAEPDIKKRFDDWKNAMDIIQRIGVPVPSCKTWDDPTMKVRKNWFSKSVLSLDGTNNIHPAPDPLLLLVKAVSNWLKRQYFPILPGCDEDNSTNSDDTCDCVTSPEKERAYRGWSNIVMPEEKPSIEGISITINMDKNFESLSDDELD